MVQEKVEQLKKIAEYIMSNYKESCLRDNYKNVDNLFRLSFPEVIEECIDFFYFEKLNWCGCGCPEDAKNEILKYFSIINFWHSNSRLGLDVWGKYRKMYKKAYSIDETHDNPLLWCLAYSMDAAGFTEHGTSISSAWLSEEGKMFLFLLANDPELEHEYDYGTIDFYDF